MRHQDLTINHILESWTFANAAARNAAGSYVSGDIGRISYQSDTGEYFRLLTITPTWAMIAVPTTATLQTSLLSPTGTSSTTAVMCGMGSTAAITPARSGKIYASFSGVLFTANIATSITVGIRYGTGTAPANGVAATGTAIGGTTVLSEATAIYRYPFSISAVISGLTLGTQIWLDLSELVAGSTTGNVQCSVAAFELP